MALNDLTIIYITASLIPEKFADYQRNILKDASGGAPIISISRKPLDFGENILDDGERSTDNIYRQMLRGIKLAKTPFIAMAEDDTLYTEEHFTIFRPPLDTFAYNQNRLALFIWGQPMYNWRNRISNATLIAPRELAIEALEERFKKWPNTIPDPIVGELGRARVDRNLGITVRKLVEFYSETSLVQFNHEMASERAQRRHTKRPGPIKAYDIPYWGRAIDLKKKFA